MSEDNNSNTKVYDLNEKIKSMQSTAYVTHDHDLHQEAELLVKLLQDEIDELKKILETKNERTIIDHLTVKLFNFAAMRIFFGDQVEPYRRWREIINDILNEENESNQPKKS